MARMRLGGQAKPAPCAKARELEDTGKATGRVG